jgi:hypothetical protein
VLAVAATAACTTPGAPSPTTSPSASPLAAGVYAQVSKAGSRHLYVLAPGGSNWRYVGEAFEPKVGQDEEVVALAPI